MLGLCLGSFATAVIWRGERGLSWIVQDKSPVRSACPECGAKLSVLDLIPFFSWAVLHGKCRTCKKPIPAFYPLTEIITMLLAVVLFWAWDFSWYAAPLLLAVPFLLAAVVIDWSHMILPDDINIALFVLALFHTLILWWQDGWNMDVPVSHGIAAIILPIIFYCASWVISKWKKRDALGMGDIKFLPSAGLFLGMVPIAAFMMAGGLLGLATALLKGKKGRIGPFPFGPALVISLYIHLILTGFGFHYIW